MARDEHLAAALKEAHHAKMHFVLIPKGSTDGVLLVSKTKPGATEIADLKKKAGGGKAVAGTCQGENDQIVFETSESISDQWEKAAKEVAKRDAGVIIKPVFRELKGGAANPSATTTPPQTPPSPGAKANAGPIPTKPSAPPHAPAPHPDQAAWNQRVKDVETKLLETLKANKGDTSKMRSVFAFAREKAGAGAYAVALKSLDALDHLLIDASQSTDKAAPNLLNVWRGRVKPVEAELTAALKEKLGNTEQMKSLFNEARHLAEGGKLNEALNKLNELQVLLVYAAPEESSKSTSHPEDKPYYGQGYGESDGAEGETSATVKNGGNYAEDLKLKTSSTGEKIEYLQELSPKTSGGEDKQEQLGSLNSGDDPSAGKRQVLNRDLPQNLVRRNRIKAYETHQQTLRKLVERMQAMISPYNQHRETLWSAFQNMEKATAGLNKFVDEGTNGKRDTEVDPMVAQIGRFLADLTSALTTPSILPDLLKQLTPKPKGQDEQKLEKLEGQELERKLEKARQEAIDLRKQADQIKEVFSMREGPFDDVKTAEKQLKTAFEKFEQASTEIQNASIDWERKKIRWDQAGQLFNNAVSAAKSLVDKKAPENEIEDAKLKVNEAKQALELAQQASADAAKIYSNANVHYRQCEQAHIDAQARLEHCQMVVKMSPETQKWWTADHEASEAEYRVSLLQSELTQHNLDRALGSTVSPKGIAPDAFKKLREFADVLKNVVTPTHVEIEKFAESARKIEAEAKALKFEGLETWQAVPLKVYAKGLERYASAASAVIASFDRIEVAQENTGVDLEDDSLLKNGYAALPKPEI